jgi:excinuclease UvrABC helicase subunit UvrB
MATTDLMAGASSSLL